MGLKRKSLSCPLLSFTTKQVPLSSAVECGGKRRVTLALYEALLLAGKTGDTRSDI